MTPIQKVGWIGPNAVHVSFIGNLVTNVLLRHDENDSYLDYLETFCIILSFLFRKRNVLLKFLEQNPGIPVNAGWSVSLQ